MFSWGVLLFVVCSFYVFSDGLQFLCQGTIYALKDIGLPAHDWREATTSGSGMVG